MGKARFYQRQKTFISLFRQNGLISARWELVDGTRSGYKNVVTLTPGMKTRLILNALVSSSVQ